MFVERYNGDGAVAVIPVISEFPSILSSEVSNAMSKIREDTVAQNRIFIKKKKKKSHNIKDIKKEISFSGKELVFQQKKSPGEWDQPVRKTHKMIVDYR